jgi:hypothetical protein
MTPEPFAGAGNFALAFWEQFSSARLDTWIAHVPSVAATPADPVGNEALSGKAEPLGWIGFEEVPWSGGIDFTSTAAAPPKPLRALAFSLNRSPIDDSEEAVPAPSPEYYGGTVTPDPVATAALAVTVANRAVLGRIASQATQAVAPSANTVLAGPTAPFAVLVGTQLRTAVNPFATSPILVAAPSVNREAPLAGGSLAPAPVLRLPAPAVESGTGSQEQPTDSPSSPAEPKVAESGESSHSPEASGLLTNAVFSGLATLERAIRDLIEPEVEVDVPGGTLLYWVGLSASLLASTLVYQVVFRRRVLLPQALVGVGPAGAVDPFAEDLS